MVVGLGVFVAAPCAVKTKKNITIAVTPAPAEILVRAG